MTVDFEPIAALLRTVRGVDAGVVLTPIVARVRELEVERYNLRGELKEIADLVRPSPCVRCGMVLHKIEGIPGMEAKS